MVKHRSRFIDTLLFLMNSYGLILTTLLLLWLLTGEILFFVNVFINVSPAVFYALPFVLFLAVLLKSRRTLLFLLIPSLTFAIWYAPRFIPRTIENATGQELILLTYNLQAGNHSYEVLDGVLRRADADIVSLQEVNRDMADWLVTEWSDEYPYFVRFSNPSDVSQYSGRYFMSRFPIASYDLMSNPDINRLVYIRSELEIAGKTVIVYNVHLPAPRYLPLFDTSLRSLGMTELLASTNDDLPMIFMGDFNMTDQSSDYRRISARYQDAFLSTSTGLGTSWPNARFANEALGFLPSLIRIDYMFFTEDFAPQETHVLREGVSDHYPLWARVVLK